MGDKMPIGKCALCLKTAPLCKSHLIPEFCYKQIYDSDHKLIAFNPTNPARTWKEQKGLRERLLCEDCEQLINDEYEKPFLDYWTNQNPITALGKKPLAIVQVNDYRRFRLFHLSILFRMAAAKYSPFDEVTLGPHYDIIREMVLNGDPGPAWKYPIVCKAMVFQGKLMDEIIATPNTIRYEGCRGYQFVFLGIEWLYFITSHRMPQIEKLALAEDGRMPIVQMPPTFHRPHADEYNKRKPSL
jgi:hypothetical protein